MLKYQLLQINIVTSLVSFMNELRISFFVQPGFKFKMSQNVDDFCFVDLMDNINQ